MSLRVVLDEECCVGHGRCYTSAPELFDSDDRGPCRLLASEVLEAMISKARNAVDNCPEGALTLVEDGS